MPTLIIGAENDTVAPVASHSKPFYTSLPATLDKAYLELNGASHFAPNSLEHDDREVQHLLAQALRRQRHPLRAVPLPAARPSADDRGVPRQLPAHLLTTDGGTERGPGRAYRGPAPSR